MSATNDLNDWPLPLERNAAVCELARVIFECRGRFHDAQPDLTQEPPHVRERYVTLAHELLQRIGPAPVSHDLFNFAANLTRAHFSTGLKRPDKVIGIITPDGD